MLEPNELEKVLQDFANYVARESKKRSPKASGSLKRSIKADKVKVTKNAVQVSISAEDYLPFIDQGVSGTKKKYKTPFGYKNKKPPVKFLQTWLKRKTGKFLTRDRKSSAFALQNHIFKYGIKPTKFFETPFEQAFKSLPEEVVEAYALDVENFMELTLKDNK